MRVWSNLLTPFIRLKKKMCCTPCTPLRFRVPLHHHRYHFFIHQVLVALSSESECCCCILFEFFFRHHPFVQMLFWPGCSLTALFVCRVFPIIEWLMIWIFLGILFQALSALPLLIVRGFDWNSFAEFVETRDWSFGRLSIESYSSRNLLEPFLSLL